MLALAALLLAPPIRAADPDTPGIVARASVVFAGYEAQAGQAKERITYISLDARVVGRPELCERWACELSSFVEEQ
jgi:hypothetical protein